MKKIIKINFELWGYGKDNFFTNLLKKDYNVLVTEDKPDFIIFDNDTGVQASAIRNFAPKIPFIKNYRTKIRESLSKIPFFGRIFSDYVVMKEKKIPILNTKAVKIFYCPCNCQIDSSKSDWIITSDYHDDITKNFFVLPWYKFYCNASKELIKHNLDIEKIKNSKTKFCNFVYSNNTPFRNKFFKKLSKYKHIDSPGKAMNNMEPIEKAGGKLVLSLPKKGKNDWQKEKVIFLKPYKFTIAFEGKYGWAVSEKIYHAMLANSIPIYWGNPDVEREFNTKSFINYHDFEKQVKKKIPSFFLKMPVLNILVNLLIIEPIATKKLIKKIIEIDNNDELYEKYLKESWYHNNKLPDSLNESVIRKKLKEIFG